MRALRGAIALSGLLALAPNARAQGRLGAEPDSVAVEAPVETRVKQPAPSPSIGDSHGISPGAALLLGIGATAVPLGVAVYAGGNSGTIVCGLIGIIPGPAVGLFAGGRSDLAWRGVLIRTVGVGLFAVGTVTFGDSFENDVGNVGVATIILGVVAGAATAGSMLWDLGITYGAVDQGRRHRVSIGVRPDGVVTATLRY